MNPWVYAAAGAAVLAVVLALVLVARGVRTARGRRVELGRQLVEARADVLALSSRLDELSAEVEEVRAAPVPREVEPYVITGLLMEEERATAPREAQLVQAIESSRPEWLPARPVREALIHTMSLAHGVRRALRADSLDRIRLEMQAEVRRSRRQRKAEVRAVRRYLRERRRSAA